MIHGEYGIEGMVLSMPAVLGEEGVQTRVSIALNEDEQKKLKQSADTLASVIKELDLK